ncbi:MAG: PAS domain S-box protein [Magnetospirillum sp.]|nr:PAS domain S-box protein [Magnetospirillum sp.]
MKPALPPPPFPAAMVGLLADLSCVLFRRSMDGDGTLRYDWVSPNTQSLFGIAPEDLSVNQVGALNAVHWADRDDHLREIKRSAAQMDRCTELFRLITADGQTHWLRGSAHPTRAADGSVTWDGAWLDVTQWMRAEHHFQTVMDHAEDCILTVDCATGIEWANAATERLFGCGEGGLRGKCLIELIHQPCPVAKGECHDDQMMACFRRGTSEVVARRGDGSTFPFEMTVSEVRSDGRLSLIVIGRDITQRKHTETALAEAEQRLRLTFEAAPIGILVADPHGLVRQSNPAFHRMVGRAADQVQGAALQTLVPELPVDWSEQPFSREVDTALDDGRQRRWSLTGRHFAAGKDDNSLSILLLVEDVTEATRAEEQRRKMERVLTEGQKLEALGRLAGGIAHELNNMLGPILMGAELLMRGGSLDDKNRERCTRIVEAAKHGRDIVRGVLAYCRQDRPDMSMVDLAPVMRQFSDLARSSLPPTVKLEVNIDDDQAMVMGNAGQLVQILLNLANNARDAMNGKGNLTVRLIRTMDEVPHALISVADSGCGMTETVAARIFDPFFTTKPVGQGTGLGLSVVHGLVTAMGGSVAVSSQPGHGAIFTIALPLADMACPTP